MAFIVGMREMTATGQHSTTCHVCNAQVFIWFVDSDASAVKVMTAVLPVPPARDCAVCRDVICVNCSAADCPHVENEEFHL